jgi:hypothetical protein
MYERTSKNTHLDTIWYEMDMLEFSYKEFMKNTPSQQSPYWNMLIEAFLLHYRNLIQFFAGSEKRHKRYKGNDLSTVDPLPWAKRQLSDEEMEAIKAPGRKLDEAYSNKISNLLQHCTIVRSEPLQGWEMEKMYAEIEPIMSAIARSFPRRPERVEARTGSTANSTATVTIYKSGSS